LIFSDFAFPAAMPNAYNAKLPRPPVRSGVSSGANAPIGTVSA